MTSPPSCVPAVAVVVLGTATLGADQQLPWRGVRSAGDYEPSSNG